MDSYLELAERVLRVVRRPLSAHAILDSAYRAGIVPTHLFGKAQHKTLQARLSEDILKLKLDSQFYRTNPGTFFLSEFRSDPDVPDDLKDPFHARRRTRDLTKPLTLAISREFVERNHAAWPEWRDFLSEANRSGAVRYVDGQSVAENNFLIWSFSIVRRQDQILSYRIGRYRDDRDAFANRRTIGFADLVSYEDATLFNHDFGITDRGLSVLLDDLDLSRSVFGPHGGLSTPEVLCSLVAVDGSSQPALIFVMEWTCPEWFEPTARRLSLNEVRWIDAARAPNDLSDFEPWSCAALLSISDNRLSNRYEEKDKRSADCVYPIRTNKW